MIYGLRQSMHYRQQAGHWDETKRRNVGRFAKINRKQSLSIPCIKNYFQVLGSVNAVLRRPARSDLWTLAGMSDVHTFDDHCNSADELFIKIRTYSNHILHGLLPPPSTASQNYKDSVHTHLSYLNAQHIFLTVISLCV